MRPSIQQGLAGCAIGILGAVAWLLQTPAPVPAQLPTPANFKPYTETVPGSAVSFEMMPIPGGAFQMGSPVTEKGRGEDEGPQHPVTLRPFWMAKTETTWDLYDLYWKSTDPVKDEK